ncbi:UNVERIFIED_CONTAM: Electron transfer flavoprotein subunit beta, mitochondrial [Sesamum latifolium]|uniref:Electron transfer flavoprotein subunit beta, mitochondrial n=1 Tax=Sesamum latifolium TaxID=2727402 RepID=A0AAW2XSY1_9LAMI
MFMSYADNSWFILSSLQHRFETEPAQIRDSSKHHESKIKGDKEAHSQDLNVEIRSDLEVVQVTEPPKRKAGVILSSVDELIDKLKNEARVL